MRLQSFAVPIALLAALAAAGARANDDELWRLLKEDGQVVLMRHTVTTPGVGDPPGMRVDDCSTQRNLTEQGQRHAKAIGQAVRAHGVAFDRVYSSPMCRCLDTAVLAFGHVDKGQATGNPNASVEEPARQVRDMRALVTEKHRGGSVVLVSHSSTIFAVTGINLKPGEMLVVTPKGDGNFEVRGRLMAAPGPSAGPE
ncbi:MAG: histidine phosphatase family protein [Usitatibacter sp.]